MSKQKRTVVLIGGILRPNQATKRNVRTKRRRKAKTKRRPPLVPTPARIAALLDLVNRLPVQFRHSYWARKPEEKLEVSDYPVNEAIILNPEGRLGNSSMALWDRLRIALGELPLALQAFILRDELSLTRNINTDLQVRFNFEVLCKSETEQSKTVNACVKRIEEAFIEERQALTLSEKTARSVRPNRSERSYDAAAKELVLRVRQRLIFVLAAQELMSCLTHPEPQYQLLLRRFSRLPDATQADLYIVPEGKDKGTLAVSPPALYDYLLGVEAARIRECPICFRFFWAGRKDKIGCSTRCSDAHRMREYRKKWGITKKARSKSAERKRRGNQNENLQEK